MGPLCGNRANDLMAVIVFDAELILRGTGEGSILIRIKGQNLVNNVQRIG